MQDAAIVEYLLNAATTAIGLYMVISYAGHALPPTLSGVAFIIIGLSQVLAHWYRLG